jgi:outer membrane protein insertion porin family/translocation and assembly module TamA
LGAAVYIARTRDVVVDTQIVLPDTTYGFRAFSEERAVPLGGNALVVTNLEYRIRDPFFLPELLQYTLFLDGGDVRSSRIRFDSLKWTPGLGVRALTPVGPVQVNIGYNGHRRESGPLYYNPDVTSLACASPGNDLRYRRDERNQLVQVAGGACPLFDPPRRRFWYQRLTFTFSLGPDF